jgi:predicted aconitase
LPTIIIKSGVVKNKIHGYMAESGARLVVPSTINAISYDRLVGPSTSRSEVNLHQRRMLEACQAMGGMATCSCNPFSHGIAPAFGEHVAWSESATTGYLKSVIGARSNREGSTAIASALTGVTPRYGMHDPSNRRAAVHYEIGFNAEDESEFNLLGSLIARRSGNRIPALSGLEHPCTNKLFGFSASFAIVANIRMFYFVRVAPEAPTLDAAFGGRVPEATRITRTDLDAERTIYDVDTAVNLDFVAIGSPHATIHQIKEVAELLGGRMIKPGVEFTLTTNRSNFALAESSGLLANLVAAGVKVTVDKMCFGCDLGARKYDRSAILATNSVKTAITASGSRGVLTR